MTTICLIPGDGVGREVVPAAAQAIATALPAVRFLNARAGWDCFVRTGSALPEETLRAVKAADATLFGATQSPTTGEAGVRTHSGQPVTYRSPILALRKEFDLYANLRPAAPLVASARALDLLIVRENTEDLYSGRERREGDTAIAERVITRRGSERIARVAFEQARRRAAQRDCSGRCAKVTIVHKANVLKVTDGLFRECCLNIAKGYPDVEVDEMLVDAAAMWLVRDPSRFDVIVTTNMFGDILSDLAAGLVGGLGVAPSGNVGAGRVAVFEPVHGSAPDIAGRGAANPIGAMISAAMLLDHVGEPAAAANLRRAVQATVRGGLTTPDLGGMATTQQVTAAVCDILRASTRATSAAQPSWATM
ncbi:MAG: isocitrate/isopropylmalate dehydrogenase family protein [Anaerolineae bacterium]|jgi:homoisocitrate dehydrogenase|nr:isocitrate/isopropylmalate dehydrogenase family protein [Anaerolineae bacterium]